ncbi:hypothetical protein N658DRAFT_43935 [Parathielavia hyrcaniae]|uniref:Uncharacterized protein n=1 Tax=Parathielavia hyrcaniae TaxID=113614 RepID=A0AAN6T2U8_9PEZI|nr:hypothetical protein N658DRAFT_43935 [Parathielavia hyrcaniae]
MESLGTALIHRTFSYQMGPTSRRIRKRAQWHFGSSTRARWSTRQHISKNGSTLLWSLKHGARRI